MTEKTVKKTVTKKTVAKKTVTAKKPATVKKSAAAKKPVVAGNPVDTAKLLSAIIKILEDGKAEDIVTIDLQGKTSLADYMVIASGTSSRQVIALAEKIAFDLKKAGLKTSLEGKSQGQWVIVDAADVIVHIFHPEIRQFYGLEELWQHSARKTKDQD